MNRHDIHEDMAVRNDLPTAAQVVRADDHSEPAFSVGSLEHQLELGRHERLTEEYNLSVDEIQMLSLLSR